MIILCLLLLNNNWKKCFQLQYVNNISSRSLKSYRKSKLCGYAWLGCPGSRPPRVSVISRELMWTGREVSWHQLHGWNWLCRAVVIRSPGQHKRAVRPQCGATPFHPIEGATRAGRCRESPIPFSLPILPFCQMFLPLVHVRQVSEKHMLETDDWAVRTDTWISFSINIFGKMSRKVLFYL